MTDTLPPEDEREPGPPEEHGHAAGEDSPPDRAAPAQSGSAPQPPAEAQEPAAEEPAPPGETAAEPATPAEAQEPAAEEPAVPAETAAEPAPAADAQPAPAVEGEAAPAAETADRARQRARRGDDASREKAVVPGADLEVDIVPEGVDPLARAEQEGVLYDEDLAPPVDEEVEAPVAEEAPSPIVQAAIDLAAGARYRATGKRKTAIARVMLRPGSGGYVVNGRALEEHFPRGTLQRNIRQPLESVGYDDKMDVVARLHGGGVSAQAGALRHGISRALLEADPNLRGELKRRGFLTRDARAKERKKAGLKKARKRPQFSKR